MTKSIKQYETDIKKLHYTLQQNYDLKLEQRLKRQVVSWVKLLTIGVRVASNEQKPWDESELNLTTMPMQKKVDGGHAQVGDYQIEIVTGCDVVTGGLIVERKEVSDLYNTLSRENSRTRFNNEITRFKEDPRFNTMAILVEGTMLEYINYVPEVYICRFDTIPGMGAQKLVTYLKRYYKLEDISPIDVNWAANRQDLTIFGTNGTTVSIYKTATDKYKLVINGVEKDTLVLKLLYGKQALYQRKGTSVESKWGTIARLDAKGIPIRWCGSRENAIKYFKYLITHWCIANYDQILNLN